MTEDPGLSVHRGSAYKFHLPPLKAHSRSPSLALRTVEEAPIDCRQSINDSQSNNLTVDGAKRSVSQSDDQPHIADDSPINNHDSHDPINRIITQAATHIIESHNLLIISHNDEYVTPLLNNQSINQSNHQSNYLSTQNIHREHSRSASDMSINPEPTSPASTYESTLSPMPSIVHSINQSHIPAISSRPISPFNSNRVEESNNASVNISSTLPPPADAAARLWSRSDHSPAPSKPAQSITAHTYVHPATFPPVLNQPSTGYTPPTRSRARSSFSEVDPIDDGNISAIHLVSLQFRRPEIESLYQEFSHSRNDRESWQLSVVCAVLYCIPFLIIEACFMRFSFSFVMIRLGVILPILFMFYLRSSRDWFYSPLYSQHALAVIALIFFFGENIDAFTSGNNQSLLDVGTPVFFFWILPAFHLKFPHALAASLCAVVSRTVCTVLLLSGAAYAEELVDLDHVSLYWAVYHEAFIWLVASVSLAYCWQSERLERREFWYRNLLLETVENNERLLQRMLPSSVIGKLQRGDSLIAEKYDNVALVFVDLIGFQQMVATCSPVFVVHVLDWVFSLFDSLSEQYGVYKVETVFDTWVGACGIQDDDEDLSLPLGERERARLLKTETSEEILFKQSMNVTRIALLALAITKLNDEVEANMRHELSQWPVDQPMQEHPDPSLLTLRARVGIHSGRVLAGVIGRKLPRYRLFGDTVNTTARMCTHGAADRVHCSPEIVTALQSSVLLPRFSFTDHATRTIKGKGQITTAYLCSDYNVLDQEIVPINQAMEPVKVQYPNRLITSDPRTPEMSQNLSLSGPQPLTQQRRPSLSPSPSPRAIGRELAISRVLSATMAPRPTGKPFFAHQSTNPSAHPAAPFFSTTGASHNEPTHVSFVDLVKQHTQLQTHDSFDNWTGHGSTSPSNKSTVAAANRLSAEAGILISNQSAVHNIPQRSRASTTHSSQAMKHARGASQASEPRPSRLVNQVSNEHLVLVRSFSDSKGLEPSTSTPNQQPHSSTSKQGEDEQKTEALSPVRLSAYTLPADKQSTNQSIKPLKQASSRVPTLFHHGLRSYKSDHLITGQAVDLTQQPLPPHQESARPLSVIQSTNQSDNQSDHHHDQSVHSSVRRIRPGHKRAVTLNDKHFDSVLGFTGFKSRYQSTNQSINHFVSTPPSIDSPAGLSARSHRMLRLPVSHTPTNTSSPRLLMQINPSNGQSSVSSGDQSVYQSINQSTNQSTRQSSKRSTGQSIVLSVSQSNPPMSHPHAANHTDEEINQSIKPDIKKSDNQPINQSTNHSIVLSTLPEITQSSPSSLVLPNEAIRASLSTVNQILTRSNTPPLNQLSSTEMIPLSQSVNLTTDQDSHNSSMAFSRAIPTKNLADLKQDKEKQILHQSINQSINQLASNKKSASVYPSDSFPNSSISSSPNQSCNRSFADEPVVPVIHNKHVEPIIDTQIKQLDTDDLPFHMLDPETMTLDFALRFVDYPDLEKNYSINRSNKLFRWVEYRIPLILVVHVVVVTIDYVSRLAINQSIDGSTGSYDGISGWTSQSINQSRFFIRLFAGILPACLIVAFVRPMAWHLSPDDSEEKPSMFNSISVYVRRNTRLHHWIFSAFLIVVTSTLVSDTINESNQDLRDTITRSSEQSNLSMHSWCSLIIMSGISSLMFHWPALTSFFFVCAIIGEYLLMFMIIPAILHALDGSVNQDWPTLCEQLLFTLCMLSLLYINARISEVRSRGRFLTLLDLRKQRKDTESLLERLLPKQIINQLLLINGASAFVPPPAAVKATRLKATSINRPSRRVSGSQWNFATPRPSNHSINHVNNSHINTLSSPSSTFASPMIQSSSLATQSSMATPLITPYSSQPINQQITHSIPSSPLLAHLYPSVTVMQADICHFTPLCARSTPQQVITMLNQLFLMFDSITDQFGVYKVETIGDAVLAVCGAPLPQETHACQMAQCALAARKAVTHFTLAHDNNQSIRMRFGLHTGPVVGGVVGLKKMPRFHIYGQTVNMAGSMEQIAEPMTIAMSEATWKAIQEQEKDATTSYKTRRVITRRVTRNSSSAHNSQQNSEDEVNTEDDNDAEAGFDSTVTHSSIRSFYELMAYKDMSKDETANAPPVRPGTASRATRLTGNPMARQHMEQQLKHSRRNQSINETN